MKNQKKSVKSSVVIIRTSKCKTPFDTLRKYLAKNFLKVRRCDAVRALEKMGIATHTARTQYQRWYSTHDDKNKVIAVKGAKVTKVTKSKPRKVNKPTPKPATPVATPHEVAA